MGGCQRCLAVADPSCCDQWCVLALPSVWGVQSPSRVQYASPSRHRQGRTKKYTAQILVETSDTHGKKAHDAMNDWIKHNGYRCSGTIEQLTYDHALVYQSDDVDIDGEENLEADEINMYPVSEEGNMEGLQINECSRLNH